MDITSTNAIDISAVSTGDCGGNTNITFTTAAAQTSASTAAWSDPAGWSGRVPLPQDDVTCSHSKTIDIPRIGKSITFVGAITVSLSDNIENYGSLTLSSGMTYTHNNKTHNFRGRDNYSLVNNGKVIYSIKVYAVGGTYTFIVSGILCMAGIYHYAGTVNLGSSIFTSSSYLFSGILTKEINLGSSVLTLTSANAAINKWDASSANTSVTAGTSTIIMHCSNSNNQGFAGGGLTYNNVRVEGAGAYALTVTGDNTISLIHVDASEAIKTVKITGGSTQTLSNLTRDAGTNEITIESTDGSDFNLVFA
jgi:hypothetical protein